MVDLLTPLAEGGFTERLYAARQQHRMTSPNASHRDEREDRESR